MTDLAAQHHYENIEECESELVVFLLSKVGGLDFDPIQARQVIDAFVSDPDKIESLKWLVFAYSSLE